jgi:hypothetical protein
LREIFAAQEWIASSTVGLNCGISFGTSQIPSIQKDNSSPTTLILSGFLLVQIMPCSKGNMKNWERLKHEISYNI